MRICIASLLRISLRAWLAGWFLAQASPSLCEDEWVYTMRPGENLWVLTDHYCDSLARLRDLQRLNRIADPYHIPPGTRLRIPLGWMKSTSGTARVAAFVGLVSITTRGVASPATPNALLHQGDLIETGANASATVEFNGGNRVTLLSESSLKLERLINYPNVTSTVEMNVPHGRTESDISNQGGLKTRIHIKTPAGITSVRGT